MNGRKNKQFNCSKIHALKIHAKRRAPARYDGATLSNDDLRVIVSKVQSGKGTFVEKKTNRVTEWEVLHKDILWRVLYDKQRHVIITCLSPRGDV